MSKAVINGQLQHLSVTAITSFDPKEFGGCNRRWWFKYVAGLPEEPQLSQITGAKIHKAIEGFLLNGTPVNNPVVGAGAHFLPERSPNILVELPTAGVLTAAGIPMKGFIDVYNKSPLYIDSMGQVQAMSPNQVEVLDWKTTSDLRYAKTGKELLTTQMVGYAKFAITTQPELTSVRLSHVYFQTKGRPGAVKNSTIISLDNILERYQAIETVAENIKQVALLTEASEVPANRASCSAYRGCPFLNSCPQGVSTGGPVETMIEKMKRAKEAQNKGPQAQPQPSSVQVSPELEQEINNIEADYAGPSVKRLGACPQCTQEVTQANGSLTPSGRVVHLGCKGVAIVPPDAPKPSTEAGKALAKELAQGAKVDDVKAQLINQAQTLAADPNKLAERPAYTPPTQEAPAKKTRGPNKPKVEGNQTTPAPEAPQTSEGILELFVDVRVMGQQNIWPLEPHIEEAKKTLADQAGVDDIRLVDNSSPLAYGKWEAFLALQMVSLVKEGKLSGRYTLSDVKESKVKQVVLEALAGHCTLLVRGY